MWCPDGNSIPVFDWEKVAASIRCGVVSGTGKDDLVELFFERAVEEGKWGRIDWMVKQVQEKPRIWPSRLSISVSRGV